MRSVGNHLIMELWECDKEQLDSMATVEQALREAASACGATLADLRVYSFPHMGVTGMAILVESHMAIHTWPEFGYAGVDIFTCGSKVDPARALPVLRRFFSPEHVQVMKVERGVFVGD